MLSCSGMMQDWHTSKSFLDNMLIKYCSHCWSALNLSPGRAPSALWSSCPPELLWSNRHCDWGVLEWKEGVTQSYMKQSIRWTHIWADHVSPSICMFQLPNLTTDFHKICTNSCQENVILFHILQVQCNPSFTLRLNWALSYFSKN